MSKPEQYQIRSRLMNIERCRIPKDAECKRTCCGPRVS